MKKIFQNIGLAALFVALTTSSNLYSQCTVGTQGQWPGGTVTPVCDGNPNVAVGCGFTDEYSVFNLTAGTSYTFTSTIGTDFFTITDFATNTPIVWGTGPLVFNCVSSGLYYFYRNSNASCANDGFVCRDISVQCGTPPPPITNDECTGAIPLCGGTISGSTVPATVNPADPFCGFANASKSVWYSIIGDGTSMTVSLCGSSYDTYLTVFGGTCGALTCVASSDDFCGASSEVTFPSVAGTMYYIQVKGFSTSSGTYSLTTPVSLPSNDACAAATVITTGTYTGTTTCSTVDVAPVAGTASVPTAGGVWYSFTTGCAGSITASLCSGTSYNSQISVYTGACGSFTAVAGNDDFCGTGQSSVTWAGAAATTYRILIHGNGTNTGSFTLNLSQVDLTAPIGNVIPLPAVNSACGVVTDLLTPPTATDNCAGVINGTTPSATFTTNGTYNITWTYNDGNGNTSTQSQTININDAVPPTIVCLNDTALSNDVNVCGATLSYQAPVCAFSGLYYDQSVDNDIIDNGYFNTSAFPDYIADDFIVPDGVCWNVTNFSANLWESVPGVSMSSLVVNFHSDAGGIPGPIVSTQTLTSADWTGTVLGTAFGFTVSDFDFTLTTPVSLCGAPGGSTYWLSIYDNAAPATAVAWSVLQPIVNNPAQQSVFGSPTGPWAANGNDFVFNIGGSFAGTVSDNCPTCATVVQTAGLPSGSVFPIGTTTNTFVATDNAGNSASCSFVVTVSDDQSPIPNIDSSAAFTFISTDLPILCPDNVTTLDSINVTGTPTVLNSGDISSVCLDIDHTWDSDMTISLISPMGTTLILSDGNGGSADDYIQTCFDMNAAINITGGTAPFIGSYIPEGAGGFDVFNGEDPTGYWKLSIFDAVTGDQGVLYDFKINFDFHWDSILPVLHTGCAALTPPTSLDNCDSALAATTSDPTSYTTDGTYIVTWTYTDAAGNTTVQTQQVIVDDATAPVPTVASLPIVAGACTATIGAAPTANDGCAGIVTGTTTDALTYNVAGTYTITWSYDDGNGNISTQTQTVVVSDSQDPVPTVALLPNAIGNCSVTVTPPTATDNCAGTITGTTTDPTTYNVIGTFFIIWHYNDGNGNTWTQNQTVVVNPCLGLDDPSGQASAAVYPNPSSGIITLSLSEMPTERTEVRLVDALGQVLYSGVLQSQVQQFDFSHLASATYYMLITNNSGQISKPVIIRQNY